MQGRMDRYYMFLIFSADNPFATSFHFNRILLLPTYCISAWKISVSQGRKLEAKLGSLQL